MGLIMNYQLLLVAITLWTAWIARLGSRDAFNYKKSKSAIKRDQKSRTTVEKILGKVDPAQTNAPFHSRLLWKFRLCNYASCALGIILMMAFPTRVKGIFIFKVAIVDVPHLLYMLPLYNWKERRYDFSKRSCPRQHHRHR